MLWLFGGLLVVVGVVAWIAWASPPDDDEWRP